MPYIKNKNGVTFLPPNTGVRNNVVGENFSASTTERIFSSVLIPANTFIVGDFFDVYTLTTFSGSNNNININLRLGTGGTTSDTLVAVITTSSGARYFSQNKRFIIRSISGNTLGQPINNNNYFTSELNLISYNINWDINNYISVSLSASTSTTRQINVEFIKLILGKCNLTV